MLQKAPFYTPLKGISVSCYAKILNVFLFLSYKYTSFIFAFIYFSILLLLLILAKLGILKMIRDSYICSPQCSFYLLLVKVEPTSISPLEIPSDNEENAIESGSLQGIQGLQQE